MTLILDFSGEHSKHHPFNVRNIKVREEIVPCQAWKNGVFPGMTVEGDVQVTIVKCFRNLIEYTRIVESESVVEDGNRYLLSSFFVNRAEGWSAEEFKPKEGKTVGYYLNGYIYSAASRTRILTALYQVHFVDMIRNTEFFEDAMAKARAGTDVKIIGLEDIEFPRLTSLLYLALQDL